jgi:hypothetical protein
VSLRVAECAGLAQNDPDTILNDPTLERPTETTPQFRHIRDDRARREAVADAQRKWDNAKAERDRLAG